MTIYLKPQVNFPDTDKYWIETKEALDTYYVNSETQIASPENFSILAPIEFIKYYDDVLPYHFSYTRALNQFLCVILHKGELENIQSSFLEKLIDSYHIIFSNPVFIIYVKSRIDTAEVYKKHSQINIPFFTKRERRRKKIQKIALVSANQFGNLGDDAITWSAHDILQEVFPKAQIQIYAPPVNKKDIFTADLLVLGGGGLFYDGCIFNAMNYTRYLAWAKEADIPSCGLGVGTQGIKTSVGFKLYKEILEFCNFISVRDYRDFEVLKYDLSIATPLHLTQDMVFSLNRAPKKKVKIKKKEKPILLLSLLDSDFLLASEKMKVYRTTTQHILDHWQEKFDIRCMVQSEDDVKMYLSSTSEEQIIRVPFSDIGQAFSIYKQADLVLTSRFHGYIFSLLTETPVIATGTQGGKIHRLITHSVPSLQNTYIPIKGFTEEALLKRINIFQNSPEEFVICSEQLHECRANSRMNAELLKYYFCETNW